MSIGESGAGGADVALSAALAGAREAAGWARAVALVEGASDVAALRALTRRCGRDPVGRGEVAIVRMAGATNIGHFLALLGPGGYDLPLAGLCDAAEERHVRRALRRAGLGDCGDRAGLERLGFFVCETDLEDELIRALGVTGTEAVIAAAGELRSYRTFAAQPAQRGGSDTRRLRRFMGTRSGRKIRYGRLLVEALDPARVPRPLTGVLARAAGSAGSAGPPAA